MRVAVTGATGNLGTSVVGELGLTNAVAEIVGIARRIPNVQLPKVRWERADVSADDLSRIFDGVDVVVHLAWVVQPSHAAQELWRINVEGSKRVFEAAANAGAALVVSSSVGVYSPGPKSSLVDESWERNGISSSHYSREKAAMEKALDDIESSHPGLRVVRMRPSLIFKGEAAEGIHKLLIGRMIPTQWLRSAHVPVMPRIDGLDVQVTHASDVARAFRAAVVKPVHGAFNIAATPSVDTVKIAEVLGARSVPMAASVARAAVAAAWRTRAIPLDPGWIDMALYTPLLDSTRAHNELDWTPEVSPEHAVRELVQGLTDGQSFPTPALAKDASQFTTRLRKLITRMPGPRRDSQPS